VKKSGWAAWRAKNPGSEPRKFTGMVGRQSKKVDGKQGMHHHPQMSQLGLNVSGGMKSINAFKPKMPGGRF
jgi:hypothetical protein